MKNDFESTYINLAIHFFDSLKWLLTEHKQKFLSLVHTHDRGGSRDGSTKSHTNPLKWRPNRRKQTLQFSSVPSPFHRVCMGLRASISVSISLWAKLYFPKYLWVNFDFESVVYKLPANFRPVYWPSDTDEPYSDWEGRRTDELDMPMPFLFVLSNKGILKVNLQMDVLLL